MRAIVIHHYGPPEVLRYEEVPDPQPRAGEIRIRVHAATVNRVLDVSLRAGKETARGAVLPLIPGVDCAGVVDALGSDIKRWRRGMRVAAAGVMPLDPCTEDGEGYRGPRGMMGIKRPGGFAELVAVPACAAVELPPGLGFHQAAVLMRHAPTAWNLLVNVAALKPGETVLIMGAGGNLGSLGIQIAKNIIGATVIAAAGSATRVQMGARAEIVRPDDHLVPVPFEVNSVVGSGAVCGVVVERPDALAARHFDCFGIVALQGNVAAQIIQHDDTRGATH